MMRKLFESIVGFVGAICGLLVLLFDRLTGKWPEKK